MVTDVRAPLSYADYLELDTLLDLQRPRTEVPDERLFIVTHQSMELWFSLALRQLDSLVDQLAGQQLTPARLAMHRLHRVVRLCTWHIEVLDTMPPREFALFRPALDSASGMQSAQFRRLEELSGAGAEPPPHSVRAAVLAMVERMGLTPLDIWSQAGDAETRQTAELRALAEDMLEYDVLFIQWRFRHWAMVSGMIGVRPGSGGSSGAQYLHGTLEKRFFPELWDGRGQALAAL